MGAVLYKVIVKKDNRKIGELVVDIDGDVISSTGTIPKDVQGDIILTYIRERVLFGRDARGHSWQDV